MAHANARTTVRGRLLIVERHRCAKTWLDRYAAQGEAGLHDRSSRPHTCPRRTSASVERAVVELRDQQRRGPDWIGAELGVAARTVSRVLARHGVPRLCALDPITGTPIRASKTTAVRYERDRPGELVHMDVKKLGRIPDGGGWRVHGRSNREDTRDRTKKLGYDYVHSVVDDHSRLAYSEILPDEQGATCATFLARAIDYFAAHGITGIQRLMTDNAWAYRWSLRQLCSTHGIQHKFIKPHCPWQNGKVCEDAGGRRASRSDSGQGMTVVSCVRSVDRAGAAAHVEPAGRW